MNKAKAFEVKRNHHYVMAEYLRGWSQNNKEIWHTTPTGKICLSSIKGVAKQEYFYRTSPLSPEQVQDFLVMFHSSPPSLRRQQLRELETYLKLQELCMLETTGWRDKKIERAVNILMCNTLENTHAIHEREAREIMKRLAEGDASALEEGKNLLKLLVFMGHQITRTRAFKEMCLLPLQSGQFENSGNQNLATRLRSGWWFFSYILGMNIGHSLYLDREKHRHCVLINSADQDFITSDQPIINMHRDLKEDAFSPPGDHQCDFFYPISPRVAFMINKSDAFPCGISRVDEFFVEAANRRMAQNSEMYIFSTTREQIIKYKGLVRKRMEAASAFYTSLRTE